MTNPSPKPLPPLDLKKIDDFVRRWAGNAAGEIKVAQQHFLELCQALDVPVPSPAEQESKSYGFEVPVLVPGPRGAAPTTERMDVFKADAFIWENKQGSQTGSGRMGHGRRGTQAWRESMHRARAQAIRYARHLEGRAPPFVVVCDVGFAFEVWQDFSGTARAYDQQPARRLAIEDLRREESAIFLRRVLADPAALDPARTQQRVTREVARELAALARALEAAGHEPEPVARFLMRCVFTMFAEDVGLLPEGAFTDLLKHFTTKPEALTAQLTHLWALMDAGGFALGIGKVPRFNGGLFSGPIAVSLSAESVAALVRAARHDWSQVEPTLFGTLVERALDPVERHRLGAHFTPREFIERLVRPTVIEPLRDDWLVVQAEVRAILGAGAPSAAASARALAAVDRFHAALCRVRVLDPACGTGNFLVVTYALLKDLEAEVMQFRADLGDAQEGFAGLEGASVTPGQLLGLEKNPRAREIADVVLWLGHLQRMKRDRGSLAGLPEPVLPSLRRIEARDAVLAWTGEPVVRRGADGAVVRVWDMRTFKTDPVTGREVPDEGALVPVLDYPEARAADWPAADFIVSNPPFVGNKRMRMALGDGYAEALRAAWPAVPGGVDLVMYWWERAAALARSGAVRRFGFITTNSITQVSNRAVMQPHLDAGLRLVYAVADHPWVSDGAAVRIGMTVAGMDAGQARLGRVRAEAETEDVPVVEMEESPVEGIHANLTAGADVAAAVPLRANAGLCFQGMNLVGRGFVLEAGDLPRLGLDPAALPSVVRPYANARDLTQGGDARWVIDFYGLSEDEARDRYPALYQRVLETVKPERDQNKRDSRRIRWWLFGETVGKLRAALAGLSRFIVTPETSKHRICRLVDDPFCPDHSLYAIALDDLALFGVLSSRPQSVWSLSAGARLGVGNDPRWRNARCFDPFPFPDLDADPALRARVADLALRLDTHRKHVQATVPKAHLTAQYNALARVRAARAGGPALDHKERAFHDAALIGVLQSLHDDLDAAVARAYGWPADLPDDELLHRLVALNRARAAEEAAGFVRYLRPALQAPAAELPLRPVEPQAAEVEKAKEAARPWPADTRGRLIALRDALRADALPRTAAELACGFAGAREKEVGAALEALAALGVVAEAGGGRYAAD